MNLMFNEISFLPHTDNEHTLKERFLDMIKMFEKAKINYGFQHIVFPSNVRNIQVTATKKFYEWAYSIPHQGDKNKILSVVRKPFAEDVLVTQVYDLSKFYYTNEAAGIPDTYCTGLATAYIKELLCSSLSSQSFWDEMQINFHEIINQEFDTKVVSATNISKEEHFSFDVINKFIEYLGDIQLIETNANPDTKPINLREDHGKDKLMAFSKRLRTSRYVLSIINSLPFNPKAINLIRQVYSDGKIELVLYWEDKGIGIIVQTTGRNYRETVAIAEELKKEFDK